MNYFLSVFSLLVLLSSCVTTQFREHQDGCPGAKVTVPFLLNDQYWSTYNGKVVIDCDNQECFPRNLKSPVACAPQCLFTNSGYGTPEGVQRAFEGKTPLKNGKTPKFIVMYGPPASGKSTALKALTRLMESEFGDTSFVEVNVDDVFQGGRVGQQFRKYQKSIAQNATTPALAESYAQRLYAHYRWVADQVSDQILNQALAARFNILWETTGATTWPRQEIARVNSYGYETWVVYPVVDLDSLIFRAQTRAKSEGQIPAPKEEIVSTAKLSQVNLVDLLPKNPMVQRAPCNRNANTEQCRANRVVLVDNTGKMGEEKVALDTALQPKSCVGLNSLLASVYLDARLARALKTYSGCK